MSPRTEAPARIAWAVDQLEVGEVDRILEIGGGRGVAAALICARLTRGSYLGITRSATAVSASANTLRPTAASAVEAWWRAMQDQDLISRAQAGQRH
jgi:protein-L-isoaspartate O-methyltransferase